ncbi:PREDICTED: 40S ribosomal protein S11 [Nipponia nippon]|nr:PREDICTED: 40S ribosomal protein S11 [Nipponia nippon]
MPSPARTGAGRASLPAVAVSTSSSSSAIKARPGMLWDPLQAIEGTYIDKKCPFTGNVSIRGRILSGVVTKMKMQRTIVIRRDYLHYIRKYNRFEKRHKNMSVHLSPCFRDVQIGDIVTVGECRPLSKTVRFNVLKVTKAAGTKKQFQKF